MSSFGCSVIEADRTVKLFWSSNASSHASYYILLSIWFTCRPGNETIHDPCNVWHFEHDDVIKWKHFLRYWHFVRGIHRAPVNSPHKGQWRGALMLSLISTWTNSRANNGDADDLRRHRAHYEVTVMKLASRPHIHMASLSARPWSITACGPIDS